MWWPLLMQIKSPPAWQLFYPAKPSRPGNLSKNGVKKAWVCTECPIWGHFLHTGAKYATWYLLERGALGRSFNCLSISFRARGPGGENRWTESISIIRFSSVPWCHWNFSAHILERTFPVFLVVSSLALKNQLSKPWTFTLSETKDT